MQDDIKVPAQDRSARQGGFIQLIIIIVVALLLLRYFGLTISGILAEFNLSLSQIAGWFKAAIAWFIDLFNSVK